MKRIFKNSVLNENNVDDILLRALLDGERNNKRKSPYASGCFAAVSKNIKHNRNDTVQVYKETTDEQEKLKVKRSKMTVALH